MWAESKLLAAEKSILEMETHANELKKALKPAFLHYSKIVSWLIEHLEI